MFASPRPTSPPARFHIGWIHSIDGGLLGRACRGSGCSAPARGWQHRRQYQEQCKKSHSQCCVRVFVRSTLVVVVVLTFPPSPPALIYIGWKDSIDGGLPEWSCRGSGCSAPARGWQHRRQCKEQCESRSQCCVRVSVRPPLFSWWCLLSRLMFASPSLPSCSAPHRMERQF